MSKYNDPKQEFERGYNFGKEEGAKEVIKMIVKAGGAIGEKYESNEIIVKLPREYFTLLRKQAESTA